MRTLTRESRQHLSKQIARFRPCIQSTRSAETIFGYSGALQHYRKARINLQQLVRMCAGISGRSGNIINSINYDFMAIALSLSLHLGDTSSMTFRFDCLCANKLLSARPLAELLRTYAQTLRFSGKSSYHTHTRFADDAARCCAPSERSESVSRLEHGNVGERVRIILLIAK